MAAHVEWVEASAARFELDRVGDLLIGDPMNSDAVGVAGTLDELRDFAARLVAFLAEPTEAELLLATGPLPGTDRTWCDRCGYQLVCPDCVGA